MLEAFLARNRELVVWKVSGCDRDLLQAEATPSGVTALGIVQHLGYVERLWFRDRVAGQVDAGPRSEAEWSGWFRVAADATAESVVAAYAAECAAADAAIADVPLDPGAGSGRPSLRWVYLHMIEETARHLGQIDLLRERADGMVGEDPSD